MIEVEPHAATELRGYNMYRKFGEIWNVVFDICESTDRQTDIHTDTLIKIRAILVNSCYVLEVRKLETFQIAKESFKVI